MKFIFPDSFDLVDPSFDFESEQRCPHRVRHQHDLYAHEVFSDPPYEGLLVSMAIVEGLSNTAKYSVAQRHRLNRVGVREFFRLADNMIAMGDCGAFTYVNEPEPPISVDRVIDFYQGLGFDFGISVDHVILGYRADYDEALPTVDPVPEDFRRRRDLTLSLASDFYTTCKKRAVGFVPVGVAQGWSPQSYAESVVRLQDIGFDYIALGGLVPLKTREIREVVETVATVRRPSTEFHLLGVARPTTFKDFERLGVVSFDTTSPLRQAFKDDRDNYYTPTRTYPAVRVPQVEANISLRRRISKGITDPTKARRLEQSSLDALRAYDRDETSLEAVLSVLDDYMELCGTHRKWLNMYREVLVAKPWKSCPCVICQELGIEVIIFRGAERNRRRGFHNLFVFSNNLRLNPVGAVA